ncbi:MAG TPA: hypothetical protein VGF98_07510 [Candidatus Tumulicola sp.]
MKYRTHRIVRPLHRLAIGVFCIALGACSGHVTPIAPILSTPNPAPAHAIVQLGLNTGVKPGLNVLLSVGGAPNHRFLLDTGSTGLWVYPHAIGRYTATPYVVTNSYGSGLMYEGVLAYTTVDFGNGLVTQKIPVALVRRATCVSSATSCPATPNQQNCPGVKPGPDAGIRCLEAGRKLFGTFGAALATIPVPSTKPVTELYNVLFGIDQPWAASFVVTPSAIEVGPYSIDGFKMIRMTLASSPPARPIPSGARGWIKTVNLCFGVGALRNYCAATTFDTGAYNVEFLGPVKLPLVQTHCGERVKSGTPFEMRSPDDTILESFHAGEKANWNVVVNHPHGTRPKVNTGLTFYNRDEILFDAANGRVGLQKLATPGQISRNGCF